ncbi:MAG: SagB/ThcOx family dehydrogenase [Anaerolineales bacterium]|jgi:SagB-type dehydrogenase family enzyme
MTEIIKLPEPRTNSETSLETCLSRRRTTRSFEPQRLDEHVFGQLLWAAQGITSADGFRTAPSAGAMYPLELYLATTEWMGRYIPHSHALEILQRQDLRRQIAHAALEQEFIDQAPCSILLAAVLERTTRRYGPDRSPRYIAIEVGHAAQNLILQATSLGLGCVPVGAFNDTQMASVFNLPPSQKPFYLITLGWPSGSYAANSSG